MNAKLSSTKCSARGARKVVSSLRSANEADQVRLLRTYETVDHTMMEDVIYVAALNVEDAMLTGGLRPGIDYTALDLYRIGMPFALMLYEQAKNLMTHVSGYEPGHTSAKP